MVPDPKSQQNSDMNIPKGDPMQSGDNNIQIVLTKDIVTQQLNSYIERKNIIIGSLNNLKTKIEQTPNNPEMSMIRNKLINQFNQYREALTHIDQAITFTNELIGLVK